MPLKRACSGCGQAVDGACPTCTRQKQKRYDASRGTSTQRGYDKHWRVTRVQALERDRWTCVDCGWKPDIVEMYERLGIPELPPAKAVLEELRVRKLRNERHLHGDHVRTIDERPDLRLTLDNIATRCDRCHAIKTAKEDGGFTGKGETT
jgi:5-methylcytosine-specific restriction endonuclease McrA